MTDAAWWAKDPLASHPAAWWAKDPVAQGHAAPKMDAAGDIGGGIVGGLARGTVGLVTAPAAVPHMLAHGAALGTEWLARKAMGQPEPTQQQADAKNLAETQGRDAWLPSPGAVAAGVNQAVDAHTYHPTTTAGKFASTISEFVPSALVGPGSALARLFETVGAGVASEAAGQAMAGTAAEPYARAAAGMGVNLGRGVALSMKNAPNRMLADAAPSLTRDKALQAQSLIDDMRSRGVDLTGPEAIQQATNNGTKLADLLRMTEGSAVGGGILAPYFAKRPEQIQAATKGALDTIAPIAQDPYMVGPRAATAAEKAMTDAAKYRTERTNPGYEAAGPTRVDPAAMHGLMTDMQNAIAADKTGVIGKEIANLHGMMIEHPGSPAVPGTPGQAAVRTPVIDPKTGATIRYDMTPATLGTPETPAVSMRPVTDIENLNRARKAQRERLAMPLAPGRDPITAEQAHAVGPFMDRLKTMMEQADPRFAQANKLYGEISDNMIRPLDAGPVGSLVKYKGTQVTSPTKVATETMFPINGHTQENQQGKLAGTMKILSNYDGTVPNDLTRQHLANTYDKAAKDLQSGEQQYVGANYRNAVVGAPQQRLNLDAIMHALPHPQGAEGAAARASDLASMWDGFQATGRRKQQGSATEFNARYNNELAQPGVAGQVAKAAATGGLSVPAALATATDGLKRVYLGKRTGDLANLFTAPDSAMQIWDRIGKDQGSPLAQMFARSMVQAPLAMRPH